MKKKLTEKEWLAEFQKKNIRRTRKQIRELRGDVQLLTMYAIILNRGELPPKKKMIREIRKITKSKHSFEWHPDAP